MAHEQCLQTYFVWSLLLSPGIRRYGIRQPREQTSAMTVEYCERGCENEEMGRSSERDC